MLEAFVDPFERPGEESPRGLLGVVDSYFGAHVSQIGILFVKFGSMDVHGYPWACMDMAPGH